MKEFDLKDNNISENLPVEYGTFGRLKNFFRLELTPTEAKVLTEVRDFWCQEIEFSEFRDFMYQDVNFAGIKDFWCQDVDFKAVKDFWCQDVTMQKFKDFWLQDIEVTR